MKKIILLSAALYALMMLSGCGGGGEGGEGGSGAVLSSEAEGLYSGTTSVNSIAYGIILDDGTFYVIYTTENNPNIIAGVVQGTSTATGGSLTSDDAMDYNIEGLGVFPATVSANYIPQQSVSGTISYTGGRSINFTTYYDSDYEITPSLTDIAGTFTGAVAFSLGVENAIVNISQSGSVTGNGESGCKISGAVTPRDSGNVYNVSVTFGGPPCYFANQTLHGIGYYDSTTKVLVSATPTAERTEGIMFVGSK